jgi:hypothetical protein
MTIRTASAAKASINTIKQLRVGTWAVSSVFSIPAGQSVSAGDVIQMIAVPDGAQVVFVGVKSTLVHAVVEVGDGLTTNRYSAVLTTSAAFAVSNFAAGVAANAVAPYTYSTDDTLDILATTAASSTVLGAFYMTAILTMDPTQYND